MTEACEICERMARFTLDSPYVIAELESGWAVLGDNQTIPGYTIFLSKTCVSELHDLDPDRRSRFLEDMALVAEAVFRAFSPRKLNYELLGNSVSHLHWHLFPRYADDPNPRFPVWNNDAFMTAKTPTERDRTVLVARRDRVRGALKATLR